MADLEKKTKRYPTDLTDEEWERIRTFVPKPAAKGRKPSFDMPEVLNAICYVARAGCGWRMLPKDFPPWQTVYPWFRRFMRRFVRDHPRCGADDRPRTIGPRPKAVGGRD
jgi:transposase